MKFKVCFSVLLACYAATFLRVFINNNFIVSVIGSFFFGVLIAKRLSKSKKQIMLSGFFSCFTSFSGFIFFLNKVLCQGDWIKFIFFLNFITFANLLVMCFGFWLSRKIT
jgi:CrcB protein